MKHLSFRILFLCIFLPPVLYVFSIQGFETLIQEKWTEELDKKIISDPVALLEGRFPIQEEIRRNVNHFLASRTLTKWGVVPRIVIRTETGRWLYPQTTPSDPFGRESELYGPMKSLEMGQENLEIMEEGVRLVLEVEISNNSWFANAVLIFYILVFSVILYRAYWSSMRKAEEIHQEALDSVTQRLKTAENRLWRMANQERESQKRIGELHGKLAEAGNQVKSTEEAALAELEGLEEKLLENTALREKAEKEVDELKTELERLETSQKTPSRKQEKKSKSMIKRFRTLYKELEFHDRAVTGFVNLHSDMQLRAEEVISNLNTDSSRLIVKRKVFARTGTPPALETEFAHKGRIYWRQGEDGKIEVLAIGTKNTQGKDLAYLESL